MATNVTAQNLRDIPLHRLLQTALDEVAAQAAIYAPRLMALRTWQPVPTDGALMVDFNDGFLTGVTKPDGQVYTGRLHFGAGTQMVVNAAAATLDLLHAAGVPAIVGGDLHDPDDTEFFQSYNPDFLATLSNPEGVPPEICRLVTIAAVMAWRSTHQESFLADHVSYSEADVMRELAMLNGVMPIYPSHCHTAEDAEINHLIAAHPSVRFTYWKNAGVPVGSSFGYLYAENGNPTGFLAHTRRIFGDPFMGRDDVRAYFQWVFDHPNLAWEDKVHIFSLMRVVGLIDPIRVYGGGVVTHICFGTSMRHLAREGYIPVAIVDATAGIVPALCDATFAEITDMGGQVMSLAELEDLGNG